MYIYRERERCCCILLITHCRLLLRLDEGAEAHDEEELRALLRLAVLLAGER